jgi:hypothetical protein
MGLKSLGHRRKMRSPDVHKALDPPEICISGVPPLLSHDETTSSVVAALDPRDATLPSTPAAFVAHIRFLGARLKAGLRSDQLGSGIPPGFAALDIPPSPPREDEHIPCRRSKSKTPFLTVPVIRDIRKVITNKREPGKTSISCRSRLMVWLRVLGP